MALFKTNPNLTCFLFNIGQTVNKDYYSKQPELIKNNKYRYLLMTKVIKRQKLNMYITYPPFIIMAL